MGARGLAAARDSAEPRNTTRESCTLLDKAADVMAGDMARDMADIADHFLQADALALYAPQGLNEVQARNVT